MQAASMITAMCHGPFGPRYRSLAAPLAVRTGPWGAGHGPPGVAQQPVGRSWVARSTAGVISSGFGPWRRHVPPLRSLPLTAPRRLAMKSGEGGGGGGNDHRGPDCSGGDPLDTRSEGTGRGRCRQPDGEISELGW